VDVKLALNENDRWAEGRKESFWSPGKFSPSRLCQKEGRFSVRDFDIRERDGKREAPARMRKR